MPDWSPGQWLLAFGVVAVVWPLFVFYTAAFWGAGHVCGETRCIESLNKQARGGRKDGDGTGI